MEPLLMPKAVIAKIYLNANQGTAQVQAFVNPHAIRLNQVALLMQTDVIVKPLQIACHLLAQAVSVTQHVQVQDLTKKTATVLQTLNA